MEPRRPGRFERSTTLVTTWHPILAADEPEPGRWVLVDTMGREYGTVAIVRLDGAVRYRAETADGRLLGWGTTLRGACSRVHEAFLRSHGPAEWAGYPRFSSVPRASG